MSLNIKNPRVHALIRELAEVTGQTQTAAVEDAVRRRLGEVHNHPSTRFGPNEEAHRRAEIERHIAQLHADTTASQRAALAQADSELYDQNGLPQ